MAAKPAPAFPRKPLPKRLGNVERLVYALAERSIDGIVVTGQANVFYLSSFNPVAHKSDEPRPYAVILSRHEPDHPILVCADYYLATFLRQPSWIEDIRPYRAVMMPLDLPPERRDIDRFIPKSAAGVGWVENARQRFTFDMAAAVKGALADLRLTGGTVAFEDMGFGHRLGLEGTAIADGYDAMMFARAVKSEDELALLQRATSLNEAAIKRTIASWSPGATWADLNYAYTRAAVELGGFVKDPGGMVWGHPRGTDQTIMLQTGLETDEVRPGSHVMFDCHGTIDLYCWDGWQDLGGGRCARGWRESVCQGDVRGHGRSPRRHASRRAHQ